MVSPVAKPQQNLLEWKVGDSVIASNILLTVYFYTSVANLDATAAEINTAAIVGKQDVRCMLEPIVHTYTHVLYLLFLHLQQPSKRKHESKKSKTPKKMKLSESPPLRSDPSPASLPPPPPTHKSKGAKGGSEQLHAIAVSPDLHDALVQKAHIGCKGQVRAPDHFFRVARFPRLP